MAYYRPPHFDPPRDGQLPPNNGPLEQHAAFPAEPLADSTGTYARQGNPSPSIPPPIPYDWELPAHYGAVDDYGPAYRGETFSGRAAAWDGSELVGYAGESYDEAQGAATTERGTTAWAPLFYDYVHPGTPLVAPTPLLAPKAVYPNSAPSPSILAQYTFPSRPSFPPPLSQLTYVPPPRNLPISDFPPLPNSNYIALESHHSISYNKPTTFTPSYPSPPYATSSYPADNFQVPLRLEEPSPPALIPDNRPPSPSCVPTVSLAASNRLLFQALPSPLAVNPGRKRGISEPATSGNAKASTSARANQKTASSRKKPPPLELPGRCWSCANDISRLVLRSSELGLDLVKLAPKAVLICIACMPSMQPRVDGVARSEKERSADLVQKGRSYADTLSAAVDRLEGLQIASHEEVFPLGLITEVPSPSKESLTCDVCDRIIAVGSVTSTTRGSSFTVEIICASCDRKYKPCSDCGGGGGRLTAGTWRCTELFVLGRRTCRLLHVRNPTLEEMTFEVHNVTDLSPSSLPGTEARCRQLYFHSRLSSLSRPESLERGEELGRTFGEIERMTIDSWALIGQHLSDVDVAAGMRRYLGLQLSVPHERRAKDKGSVKEKVITGFIFAELELSKGAIFLATIIPWAASGHALQAARILNQEVIDHANDDIASFNLERNARQLPPYPPVRCTWFMSPFKRDSRLMQSALKSGYLFAEDYLKNYPLADSSTFPPARETWIPRQFVHAWEIMVCPAEPGRLLGSVQSRKV